MQENAFCRWWKPSAAFQAAGREEKKKEQLVTVSVAAEIKNSLQFKVRQVKAVVLEKRIAPGHSL